MHGQWKQGQVSWKVCRTQVGKDGVGKTKRHLELNLASDMKTKEGLLQTCCPKKEGQRRYNPLIKNAGKLLTPGEG